MFSSTAADSVSTMSSKSTIQAVFVTEATLVALVITIIMYWDHFTNEVLECCNTIAPYVESPEIVPAWN